MIYSEARESPERTYYLKKEKCIIAGYTVNHNIEPIFSYLVGQLNSLM